MKKILFIKRFLYTLFLLKLLYVPFCFGQQVKTGIWQGNIHYSQATIPFTFDVEQNGAGSIAVALINGEERIPVNNIKLKDDSLIIPMHVFDASIQAGFSEKQMEGYWIKNRKVVFSATFKHPRFKSRKSKMELGTEYRVNMTLSPPGGFDYKGIGIFNQTGNRVTGTIMTEVGDYRYFEGVLDRNTLKLSTFDGVHAFLLTGELKDGKWSGEFYFDDQYTEKWAGFKDPDFQLTDPFEMVTIENDQSHPYFDILAPASGRNSVNYKDYAGKVLIIQLFGTWCPNSWDQNKYLVDWYRKNNDRGVEILSVSYEVNYSDEYGLKRIDDYRDSMGIPWEIKLGGRVNKQQAAMAFPFIKRLQAFPTLIVLDKRGNARYVQSYFLGPATGQYYTEFDKRFNEIIDELLDEK